MSLFLLTLVGGAVFAAAAISGLLGMAGGSLLMAVLTHALPVSAALALHGAAQQLRAAAGIGTLTVSLSHEQNYALAVVGAAVGFQTPPC